MRRQITLGETLDANAFGQNASVYHCMPGKVVAFHAASGGAPASVDVQPTIDDARLDTVLGATVFEPWPVIPSVPIGFPKMAGLAMWGRLAVGDAVVLLAFDLDPSTFRATGQQGKPVFTRRNSGCHWLALPFDITDAGALPDPGSAICLGKPGGVMVSVDGTKVNLGAAAPTDAVGLASKIDQAVSAIVSAFNAHTHVITGTCAAAPGPIVATAATPASPISPQPSSASGTVKCQP